MIEDEKAIKALSLFMGGLGKENYGDITNGMFIASKYVKKISKTKSPFEKSDFQGKSGCNGLWSHRIDRILACNQPPSMAEEVDNEPFTRVGRALSCYNSYQLGSTAFYFYSENNDHMFPEEYNTAKKIKKELDEIFKAQKLTNS